MNKNEASTTIHSYLEKDKEISMFDILHLIFKYKWIIIFMFIAGLIFGAAYTKLSYKEIFVSKGVILLDKPVFVEKGNSWLYQQFTRNIVQNTYKPVIYSNENLRKLLQVPFSYKEGDKEINTTLLKFFAFKDINSGVGFLKNSIVLDFNKQTYTLEITCSTRDANASAFIANELIKQLNLFYNNQLEITSQAEAKDLQNKLVQAKKELEDARSKYLKLRETNKLLTDNEFKRTNEIPPKLKLEEEKTQELLKEKGNLYNSIISRYNDLRFTSGKTSLVTIIENPEVPIDPIPLNHKYTAIFAFVGLIFAAGIIFLIEFWKSFLKHHAHIT